MATNTYDAVVVGGSISGLMHGVVLKALGHRTLILESREPEQLRAQAAGLSLGPEAQRLMRSYCSGSDTHSVKTPATQFIGEDGTMLAEIPIAFSVTISTWALVFERLKARFEDQTNGQCSGLYRTQLKVLKVEDDGGPLIVTYEDISTGERNTTKASLVIAADGSRSILREQFLPGVRPEYAGYLAWRGFVPESQTPGALKGALDGKLVMSVLDGNNIVAYLTPSLKGSITEGERLLDWCWYDHCDKASSEFTENMTDQDGYVHNNTVPRWKLDEEVWRKRLTRAGEVLPHAWKTVVTNTETPFITAVTSFESSKASLLGGRLLLAGEAFTQFRPHLGLGCNLAAVQALALVDVLKRAKTIETWEKEVVDYAQEFAMRSSAMGQFSMTGKWPEGYVPLYAKGRD